MELREVHIFEEPGSKKLEQLRTSAPYASEKLDCVPDGVGGICFNVPWNRAADFEETAIDFGVSYQWGLGGGGVLQIYRRASDNSLVRVGSVSLAHNYQKMIHQGRYIYACKASSNDQHLAVIDVGRPNAPAVIATIDVGIVALNLHAMGNWVFVCGTTGVKIVDVSVPATPVVRGTVL